MLEDQEGYYLIAYRPGNTTFRAGTQRPRFHKISVRVHRAGVRVRSRTGFYGVPSPEVRAVPKTPEEHLAAALRSPFAASEIRLRLTPVFTNHAEYGSVVRNLLHLDAHDLSFSEASPDSVARVEIAAVAYGNAGEPVARKLGGSELRVHPADFAQILDVGLLYEFDLPIDRPGPYQVQIAVRDSASGKIGSASQFIATPDVPGGRFALSGIVLRAEQGGSEPAADALSGSAIRIFHPGQLLSLVFQVYNVATLPPRVEMRMLLWREGQLLLKSISTALLPADQSDPKRLMATASVRLGAHLQPGSYALELQALDRAAKGAQASQWIDFEVAP